MFRTIVVGTDGTDTAERAVDAAAALAQLTGGQLHIVSAYRPVRSGVLAGAGAASGMVSASSWLGDDERVTAEEVVRRSGERWSGLSPRTVTRLGEPADALLAVAAELGADLLVVGNRGQQSMRRYLLGSVADRVAHHAPCSVHIVHTC